MYLFLICFLMDSGYEGDVKCVACKKEQVVNRTTKGMTYSSRVSSLSLTPHLRDTQTLLQLGTRDGASIDVGITSLTRKMAQHNWNVGLKCLLRPVC
jgi:hypothetical protein